MEKITKSDDLRLYNRARVLSCLRHEQPLSRTSIVEFTGLSGATVSQVTAELLSDAVIETHDATPNQQQSIGRRGRPQVMLGLKAEVSTTAVISLLLNQIDIALFDYCGNLLHQSEQQIQTDSLCSESLTSVVYQSIDHILSAEARWRSTLRHIAVVYQGTVSSNNDTLLWSPVFNVRNVPLAERLESRYGVGTSVLNDCNVIASALYRNFRPGIEPVTRNFAAVLLSYGIGLGLFHNDQILTGSRSSGMEFGHMLVEPNGALCRCGRFGCIEAYASDYAIWRNASGQSDHSVPANDISARQFDELVTVANLRDGPERQAFEKAGAVIGLGLSNLFTLFDPFPVVLVGTTSAAFQLMKPSMYSNLRHFGLPHDKLSITIYEQQTERKLVAEEASWIALNHIDREVFGFGERG